MKILFLILASLIFILILLMHLTQKEEKRVQKRSRQPSDIVLRSKNQDVKIVLFKDQNKDKNEAIIQAEVYFKNKPISYAGSPLLFEIGTFNGKFPAPQKILKKIYFLSTDPNFLSHSFSSRIKQQLLSRIFTIRSKNVQNKVLTAIKSFNPALYKKLKKQQEIEQKMAELLLSQTKEAQNSLQEQKNERLSKGGGNDIIADEIDLADEEMINILPSEEIKNYQSAHQDIENESVVNILPSEDIKIYKASNKNERS